MSLNADNKYLASIVIPAHNSEAYIEEAIRSCLNQQTDFPFEVVIVNDRSTDRTKSIVESYIANHDNVRLLDSPGTGVGAALAHGFAAITSEYVVRMDSDDIMLPHRLEYQIRFMEENSEVVMCGAQIELFGNDKLIAANKYHLRDSQLRKFLLRGNAFADPTIIVRSKYLQRIRLRKFNFDGAEQYALWLAISQYGELANLPEVLLKYRVHNAQFTQRRRLEVVLNTARVQLLYALGLLFKKDTISKKLRFVDRFHILVNVIENIFFSLIFMTRNHFNYGN